MKQRIITAIIALLIFVPIVLYGGLPFILFVYFLGSLALSELLKMGNKEKDFALAIFSYLTLWIILLPSSEYVFLSTSFSKTDVMIVFIMILLLYTVLTKNQFTFSQAGFVVLSIMYTGLGFYFLLVARTEGLNYILFILFIIWATDSGAYFVGRSLGKRKLWPEISPNKTVGGAVGGLIVAAIVGIVFQIVYPFDHNIIQIILISISISAIGQIGDLVASGYKRHYKVKDSGKLLPGHGGILDRLDSLIFVLPFLYVIQFIG